MRGVFRLPCPMKRHPVSETVPLINRNSSSQRYSAPDYFGRNNIIIYDSSGGKTCRRECFHSAVLTAD
jgi:hypothetical protein